MRNTGFAIVAIGLCALLVALAAPAFGQETDQSGADTLGWKLSIQAWTNNRATLFETFELAQRLGIRYVEAFPGQRLSPDFEGGMGPDMNPEQIAALKAKAEECGVTLAAFGVTGVPGDDEGAKAFFEWAKELGIGTITCEPGEDQVPQLDRYANEYDMKIAIHNHPKDSHYWNPETVLAAGQLAELKRQGFKGVISIEYEHQWDEDTLAECVAFFHEQANALAVEIEE